MSLFFQKKKKIVGHVINLHIVLTGPSHVRLGNITNVVMMPDECDIWGLNTDV